jgi:hypothetical protein
MSELPAERDAKRWANTGHRWTVQLAIWLAVNFSLLTMALCGYGTGAANSSATVMPAADTSSDGGTTAAVVADVEVSAERREPAADAPSAAPAETHGEENNQLPASSTIASAVPNDGTQPAADSPGQNVPQAAGMAVADSPLPPAIATTTDETPCPIAMGPMDQGADAPIAVAVIIVNPPATRGAVNYVVDGEVLSLLPGEYHRREGSEVRSIVFHQGDDFGITERMLGKGVYVFGIGDEGWELAQAETSDIRRLLGVCRPAPLPQPADELEMDDLPY